MCLPAEYHLLACVPLVPRCCPAVGRDSVCGAVPPGRHEGVRRVSTPVSPWLQPGEILPCLCRQSPPPPESRQRTAAQGIRRGQLRFSKPCNSRLSGCWLIGGLILFLSSAPEGPQTARKGLSNPGGEALSQTT